MRNTLDRKARDFANEHGIQRCIVTAVVDEDAWGGFTTAWGQDCMKQSRVSHPSCRVCDHQSAASHQSPRLLHRLCVRFQELSKSFDLTGSSSGITSCLIPGPLPQKSFVSPVRQRLLAL